MITEDQTAVVTFLAAPSTHGGVAVERIDTHAAVVFLAGDRAFKLKRAVCYDYLDFSTVEQRREMCEAEVRINRRTAPALYRGVVAVTREADESLAFGGSGAPVDWVIEMTRFDQDGLFDRLAARGALGLELMAPLGAAIARFHNGAGSRFDHGGRAGMAWVVNGNAEGLTSEGTGILPRNGCATITSNTRYALDLQSDLLDARRNAGLVRDCHGDLHLRNIVLIDGRPTLFDAIEFNDEIACIDVLYDLSFLLMDLWRRQLPEHANHVWNAYLAETVDLDGLPLLPLFLSCRAAVRAKTSAAAARVQVDVTRRAGLETLARDYLAMAGRLLQSSPPCLIAVGGFSGSGKSSLALALAPSLGGVPGAVVIRSDDVRKRLCGVKPLDHLGPESYTAGVNDRVYAAAAGLAGAVVRGGYVAIVDAVFGRPADRDAIRRTASAAGVQFAGVWLDAPEPVLIVRAEARRADPSDADATVIRRQLAEPTGAIDWQRLDASVPMAGVREAATALLSEAHIAASPGSMR
ncbi:MAG: AAA family ATPase [Acidobacteriota bacterium]|nr:AAA family ATPase [Acidobacteriota bacterium]